MANELRDQRVEGSVFQRKRSRAILFFLPSVISSFHRMCNQESRKVSFGSEVKKVVKRERRRKQEEKGGKLANEEC
jgi:hypothetical protein